MRRGMRIAQAELPRCDAFRRAGVKAETTSAAAGRMHVRTRRGSGPPRRRFRRQACVTVVRQRFGRTPQDMGSHVSEHVPVMLEEVVGALAPRPGGRYVDCTFGRGGHTRAVLDRIGPEGRVLAIDRDPQAVAVARELARSDRRVSVHHARFGEVGDIGDAAGRRRACSAAHRPRSRGRSQARRADRIHSAAGGHRRERRARGEWPCPRASRDPHVPGHPAARQR